ncbi:MAG TPA: LysM peptidoglycan-binding domain-containing protein [Bacteroidales bacterium]|nr:LysM peptidoglycan-binding domain-containing protein [Bacteroidales bacterium]HSA42233.1 LysM peptidoglycan-binding domain-containing protein [Bacteroidales bacterium]
MITRKSRHTRTGFLLIIACFFFTSLQSSNHSYQPSSDTSRNLNVDLVRDNPIIAMLDSLARLTFNQTPDFTTNRDVLNIHKYEEGYVPEFSDSVYTLRLRKLSQQSPFEYRYNNIVRQYIDLYAVRKRDLTQRILGLSGLYFPLFEEQLDRLNLPLELKYLAVIESALNPVARSHAGAKGLWQFMFHTGKLYNLKVSSYVDERNDPYKATIAACEHLRDLYAIYHDWSLVLAAYNSGAGNVNRAIRKSGGIMDFWTIMRYLPRETRDYVPAFIAASYVLHHAADHNLYPVHPGILYTEVDTVTVRQALTFDQISEMFNIPLENIRFLNPAYTKDLIPAGPEQTYALRLPLSYVADFLNNEEALYQFKTQKGMERDQLMAQIRDVQERSITHVVRKGETLGSIARKYRCSVADLKRWNGIRQNHIKANRELIVYTAAKNEKTAQADAGKSIKSGESTEINPGMIGPPVYEDMLVNAANDQNTAAVPKNRQDDKFIYHTIRHGDTLWGIANKYQGVTVEQIKQWNQIKNARQIKPGQKLKIALGEG